MNESPCLQYLSFHTGANSARNMTEKNELCGKEGMDTFLHNLAGEIVETLIGDVLS